MKLIVKRIICAVVFWSIVLNLIMGIGFYLRPLDPDNDNWHYYYTEEDDSIDVLFIGSSAIFRFWLPMQAYEEKGFTSYMLTHGNQPMEAIPYIMEEGLKTQDPDVIVVEVRRVIVKRERIYKGTLSEERENYCLSRISSGMRPSLVRTQMINDLLIENENNQKIEWIFPLLKYHDNILKFSPEQIKERLTLGEKPMKGTRQTGKIKSFEQPTDLDAEAYKLTDEDKKQIDLIAEKAEKLGKELLFVSTPYVTNEYRYPLQKDLDAYMEEKGYAYVNLQDKFEELGLDTTTDYFDANHVNIVGATKVTSYLEEYLVEHYPIQNTLTETQKQSWDNALMEWKEKEKELMETWEKKYKRIQKKLNK